MYASANGHHAQRRSRRTHSDPGQPYVNPPYTIRRPAPLHQATDPIGMIARPGTPYPFVSHQARSHLSPYPTVTNAPGSNSTSVFPRPPSPQRLHQQSASGQGDVRAPQEPLVADIPLRPALSRIPSAVTAMPHPHPYPASWGQVQGHGVPAPSQHPPAPSPFQSAGMQRQGSQHTVYQQVPAGVYQVAAATHVSHRSHRPSIHHHSSTSQHPTHHRSRSRPPSAASHRYATNITQPVHGHEISASSPTPNGVPSQRVHRATTPPSGMPFAHTGTGLARTPSVSPHRSLSHTRVSPSDTAAPAHLAHRLEKHRLSVPSPPLAASELRRSPHRPALPANYDGRTQTRYVNMLLALDGISPLFNILAAFFTWILLAGFLLFPGTFASLKDQPAGSPQSTILSVVNHVSLYVIAWLCTGIGAAGMIWLWWRWYHNYIWISNRIFIPGCLNSIAGVISTLSSIYGAQAGVFGESEKSTIIVTSVLSLICGILVLVYEIWLIRNLRLEHDRLVGVELAGKHGEGVLGERREGQS